MTQIVVQQLDDTLFEVTVESAVTTTHRVTVEPSYAERLTKGKIPVEVLVRRSFEFLLEREANTSILRRFDLPAIVRYFPEYEKVIRSRVG